METFITLILLVAFGFCVTLRRKKNSIGFIHEEVQASSDKEDNVNIKYPECQPFYFDVLPTDFDKSCIISSESNPDVVYTVNIFEQTCTCPDFTNNRCMYLNTDVRRPCKHIITAMKKNNVLQKHMDELPALILWGYRDKCYLTAKLLNTDVVIGFTPGNKWISIYTAMTSDLFSRSGLA